MPVLDVPRNKTHPKLLLRLMDTASPFITPAAAAATVNTAATTTASHQVYSPIAISSSGNDGAGGGGGSYDVSGSDALQIVLLGVVGTVSAVSNLGVLLTVLLTRKLRATPSTLFVTNLALADVMLTSLTVPLAVCGLVNKTWVFSQAACTALGALGGVFSAASALSVAAIAMDRYLAILHCLRYSVWPRWRYVLLGLMSAWLPAFFFGVLLSSNAAAVSYVPGQYLCDVVSATSEAYVWMRSLVVFVLPLSLLIFAYARVIQVARIHSRRIDVEEGKSRKGSNDSARRAETVTPNGAVAAGAMFSVRRLSILSLPPQGGATGRQKFRFTGDLELVSTGGGGGGSMGPVGGGDQDEAGQTPHKRSCAAFKLVILVLVFALCCGFHSLVGLLDTVLPSQVRGQDRPLAGAEVAEVGDGTEPHLPSYSVLPSQGGQLATASNATGSEPQDDPVHHLLLTVGLWLLVLNSTLNPFLYAISSQRFRFFAARLLSRHEGYAGSRHGGTGMYGGHLFDVSIYSAFLRNLQVPASRRSSADSCDLSQQHFLLTRLEPEHAQAAAAARLSNGLSRQDSSSSVYTSSSTVADNASPRGGGSPLLSRGSASRLLPKNASASKFLEVPAGDEASPRTATASSSSSASASPVSPLEDPEPMSRNSSSAALLLHRESSSVSTTSLRSSGSNVTARSVAPSATGNDTFYFSADNAARIRIVVDLV